MSRGKKLKKGGGGRGLDLGIRGENFSPGLESSSIDKCLNFPSRKKGEGKVSSVLPANRESFIRKMAGLKLVEKG